MDNEFYDESYGELIQYKTIEFKEHSGDHQELLFKLDQLTSEYGEQFEEDEAQYAIDNLEADYNENALLTAKNYQDAMSMSTSAIYDQLTSAYGEQFTAEEAQYAIDHLND